MSQAAGSNALSTPFNIMLSAAGRRVGLLRLLDQSLDELGLEGHVIATDITLASAAMHAAGEHLIVPPYRDPQCLTTLLRLCEQRSVRLIVPTIDTELAFYARHRDAFAAVGCAINVSSQEVVQFGGDKQKTHDWLIERRLPTVRQWTLEAALAERPALAFPVIAKPRFGSSSIGLTVERGWSGLEARAAEENLIVQSMATGREYTVDVFVDRQGRCRCAVPRLRIETRGGEVSKGMTARLAPVIDLATRVAEALPGAYGVLNIQIFYDAASGALNVIEINPRFGGGYPLTHAAGAPMARWVIEELIGRPISAQADAWTDGLVMLRYDEAVFVDQARPR